MGRRRQGRGRLNSVELLPEHADDAVRWAMDALASREFPANLILERFNEMLAALDPPCAPISSSAFNRYSLRFSAQARRLSEAREMAAALAERLDDMPEGDIGLMVGETIKALLNDVLLDGVLKGDSPSLEALRTAAETVERLEKGRKANVDTALRARAAVMKKAAEALDAAVGEGALDKAAAQQARRVMGFAE